MWKANRREFLAASAALPVLAALRSKPAYAETPKRIAPWEALRKYIEPGADEFAEEKEAEEIRERLERIFSARKLPNELLSSLFTERTQGFSPWPREYRSQHSDLKEAVYDQQDRRISDGFAKWVDAILSASRSSPLVRFYPLPQGVVRFEIASEDAQGSLTWRVGRWRMRWQQAKLVEFTPLEEHVAAAPRRWFRDVTAESWTALPCRDQLARGVPYWRARLDPAVGIDIYGSNGLAVGDVDGDGRDEVYVCQPGGLPNRLLKFDEAGRAHDITDQWGAGLLDDTSCALFLDLRNSGRQDLVVLRSAGPVLFLNDGARFRMRTDAFQFATAPGGNFTGMAAADYDRDGRLDLYLCCYVYFQSEAQYTYAVPYHDAQNGPPNFLFHNNLNADGSGFFTDATEQTGMNQNNNRFSFAPAWCDFNGDGWPDLFVANDFGRKNLYVNTRGHFEDKAAEAGVEDIGPGMSAAWFDLDHDGRADLYVANMWTAAGQRVVEDPNFAPAHANHLEHAYERHTMGNSLYRNRGDGRFEDVTMREQVGFGRWAWAAGGHDLDNDGEPEIYVACGMLTNTSTTDLNSFFWRQVVAKSPVTQQPSAAYENGWNAINQFIREEYSWNGREPNVLHARRGDKFFDFSGVSGLNFADDTRAFVVFDFDDDGRPDVMLKSRLGPQVRLLQNDCAGTNHSIAFQLRGVKSNWDAIGARVTVDGRTKWLDAGSGFLSQHSKRLLFGLGSRDVAHEVRILWPSGEEQIFHGLRAGRTYLILEGSPAFQERPFRAATRLAAGGLRGENEMRLQGTWFREPVPLPLPQRGPGLFVLREKTEEWEIFRRYLFDWRTGLQVPLAFLLNERGEAVKVYAQIPGEREWRADLAQIGRARELALPYKGEYVGHPHRDFFKFGAAYLWAGYSERALPYLEKVLERTPDNARVLVLVGQIHLEAKRYEAARGAFEKAVESNARYAEAWAGLGDLAQAHGDMRTALTNYRRALELKPDLFYTLLNAGRAADQSNDFAEAQSFYERAHKIDGSSAEAANGLGLALAKQGKLEDAKPLFERAIQLKRDYADAINNLAVLYIEEGKTADAEAAFEYGIGQAPDEDILYLNLGRMYARRGEYDRARELMRKLLERKPEDETALKALRELEGK
ncbi:MAG TPA: FG-GAP-like repeat-containing protein [Bryobacteraceae bacterium]|nr:FG-GAP-like repeat-containing protein [Bryobacteraceae bacterium]